MLVIIAGSRTIRSAAVVNMAIAASRFTITGVLSGAAQGVDKLGEAWAAAHGVPVQFYAADWEQYGRAAGFKRNAEMAQLADALVAVWDGRSRGTYHMIETMRKLGKPVSVTMA